MNINVYVLMLVNIIIFGSCKKFIQVETPPNLVVKDFVFSNDANATAAMLSIYSRIMNSSESMSGGFSGISTIMGISADELRNYRSTPAIVEISANSILQNNGTVTTFWTQLYKHIYDANLIIEGVNSSNGISSLTRDQLDGEAKVIRALCYFYLTNLFGDVPLLLSTDYRINSVASRTSQDRIYMQIISDLKDAQTKLNINYLDAQNSTTTERLRPNKSVATALLVDISLKMAMHFE